VYMGHCNCCSFQADRVRTSCTAYHQPMLVQLTSRKEHLIARPSSSCVGRSDNDGSNSDYCIFRTAGGRRTSIRGGQAGEHPTDGPPLQHLNTVDALGTDERRRNICHFSCVSNDRLYFHATLFAQRVRKNSWKFGTSPADLSFMSVQTAQPPWGKLTNVPTSGEAAGKSFEHLIYLYRSIPIFDHGRGRNTYTGEYQNLVKGGPRTKKEDMRDRDGSVPVGPFLSRPVVVAWRADESNSGAPDWPGPLGEACKHCTAKRNGYNHVNRL
jgi:hypothetical protein